jgi:periplasmic protein TonB
MKTKASASDTWDDLVFENRHKDYGAYAVRRHYSQNMTTGLGVSVSMACVLLFLPKILTMFGADEKIIAATTLPTLTEVITIVQPPLIEPPPVTPPPAAATQPMNNNIVPQVTSTAPIDVTTPTNDEIVSSISDPGTGEGSPVEGIPDGSGLAQAAVVPAVTAPPTIFVTAEVMPQYKGGLQAIAKLIQRKVRTPRSVSSQGISGTVYVQFVVRSDGSVTDVTVIRGIAADADREAVRLVSLMEEWTPGSQNHQPVSVRMVLPIKFQAGNSEF